MILPTAAGDELAPICRFKLHRLNFTGPAGSRPHLARSAGKRARRLDRSRGDHMAQGFVNEFNAAAQALIDVWEAHAAAEFEQKDADAAIATMTSHPVLIHVPVGTGATGREPLRKFYREVFIPPNTAGYRASAPDSERGTESSHRRVHPAVHPYDPDGLVRPGDCTNWPVPRRTPTSASLPFKAARSPLRTSTGTRLLCCYN